MGSSYNRNPNGNNQYGLKPKSTDQDWIAILQGYHREGLSSNTKILERIKAEYPGTVYSTVSSSLIKKHRKHLKLYGSSSRLLWELYPWAEIEQMVVRAMEADPTGHHGVRTTQALIAHTDLVHIPRRVVDSIMHTHHPEGFFARGPNAKRIFRVKKIPVGIHEKWAADGHDKLSKIGFPIYAIVDDATGRWLGAWVVPNNRLGHVVAYLYLCLVEEYGGMPLQTSMDCGSETTQVFGIANALRPEIPLNELPAVRYMRSVHNISIERAWLRLRLDWGNNVVEVFNRGIQDGTYNEADPLQSQLVAWLWPKMLQASLDDFRDFRNGAKMRKDNDKAGPSGCSRNEAFFCYEEWGGTNLLQPVDVGVVREMKKAMGGDDILKFVPDQFASACEAAFQHLDIPAEHVNLGSVWGVFREMLKILSK
ncbi:hypothetical protein MD484_g2022, partial [Candolleomyces efflorescens]